MAIDFTPYRRLDGSIDLAALWLDNTPSRMTYEQNAAAVSFLTGIEDVVPISSRQVTALAISMAAVMATIAGAKE